MKFQLQFTVEIYAQRVLFPFTHWISLQNDTVNRENPCILEEKKQSPCQSGRFIWEIRDEYVKNKPVDMIDTKGLDGHFFCYALWYWFGKGKAVKITEGTYNEFMAYTTTDMAAFKASIKGAVESETAFMNDCKPMSLTHKDVSGKTMQLFYTPSSGGRVSSAAAISGPKPPLSLAQQWSELMAPINDDAYILGVTPVHVEYSCSADVICSEDISRIIHEPKHILIVGGWQALLLLPGG